VELVDEIRKDRRYNTNITDKESAHNFKGKYEGRISLQRNSGAFFRYESFL
jgi:hypothetical protein